MISGKLTPIPLSSITETTVWHKKFFHISQNFVNKMRLVPIFHIQQNCTSVFFTYPLAKMVIMVKLTLIPQNNFTEAILWHKKFFHISHRFVNKMRLVPIFHICAICVCYIWKIGTSRILLTKL